MGAIELTKQDKKDLLEYLNEYSKKIRDDDLREIETALNKKISRIRKNRKMPAYVKAMLKQVKWIAGRIESDDIDEAYRNEAVAALHYFIMAEDRIPDYIPVVGYLDDAYIISVVYKRIRNS